MKKQKQTKYKRLNSFANAILQLNIKIQHTTYTSYLRNLNSIKINCLFD